MHIIEIENPHVSLDFVREVLAKHFQGRFQVRESFRLQSWLQKIRGEDNRAVIVEKTSLAGAFVQLLVRKDRRFLRIWSGDPPSDDLQNKFLVIFRLLPLLIPLVAPLILLVKILSRPVVGEIVQCLAPATLTDADTARLQSLVGPEGTPPRYYTGSEALCRGYPIRFLLLAACKILAGLAILAFTFFELVDQRWYSIHKIWEKIFGFACMALAGGLIAYLIFTGASNLLRRFPSARLRLGAASAFAALSLVVFPAGLHWYYILAERSFWDETLRGYRKSLPEEFHRPDAYLSEIARTVNRYHDSVNKIKTNRHGYSDAASGVGWQQREFDMACNSAIEDLTAGLAKMEKYHSGAAAYQSVRERYEEELAKIKTAKGAGYQMEKPAKPRPDRE